MAELVRVGQPGAQYLLTVPDPVAETVQKNLAPDSYFQKPNHIRIFQRDEFEQLVRSWTNRRTSRVLWLLLVAVVDDVLGVRAGLRPTLASLATKLG